MRIDFNISPASIQAFEQSCEATIRNVGGGTKTASMVAGLEIMTESMGQVPVDTGTLVGSSFLGVARRTDVKNYRYGAVMGYGDPSTAAGQASLGPIEWINKPTSGVNPKSGQTAAQYAMTVHEDLSTPHKNGKAKFLEDPLRDWASGKFARVAMTYWQRAIKISNKNSK